MVSQDLVQAVESRLAQGESREEIREFLLGEGWREEAIAEAFAQIPAVPTFWKQLSIYPYLAKLDEKSAALPARVVLSITLGLVVFVIGIAFLLFRFNDPSLFGGGERDRVREETSSQLQTALARYFDAYGAYPAALTELIPTYLRTVPQDPKTLEPYDYAVMAGGRSYKLCILFETRSQSRGCVQSEDLTVRQGFPSSTPLLTAEILHGMVFLDENQNGVREEGEQAFASVEIAVADSAGRIVCSVMTDIGGIFSCSIDENGEYQVVITAPTGYRLTRNNPQRVSVPVSPESGGVLFGVAPVGGGN